MPKHSPYKSRVDQVIQRLSEGGFVDRWKKEMNSRAQKNNKMVIVAKLNFNFNFNER